MKKIIYTLSAFMALSSCKSTQKISENKDLIVAKLDLVDVREDKVHVSVDPDKFTSEETIFYIPKTVPGTYSTANYGQFVESVKALDYDGNELHVTKLNENSWQISDAKQLDKISYWVNDTYDIKGEEGVFSPAGTNIEEDENFMLNLHGFVGYFEGLEEKPYKLMIKRPADLYGSSSLDPVQLPAENDTVITDVYSVNRYFQVTDHPIMYSEADTTSFELKGMKVLLSIYSPNHLVSVDDISAEVKKMVEAQKSFMGDINNTDVYAILLYLSEMDAPDARGFGALEHHTSTTVVLPEMMPVERLRETMTNVVSHEFFHTITPLSVHSKEVHYFDYNDPEMSKHLWMYEGVTEYFANLFQVNQGLITNQEFYDRMAEKISASKNYKDTISFTKMSENVLEDAYKDQYGNVYQKGALIGMALDIRLRELSNGEMGLLDLMKKLSEKYGKTKPFNDDELIDVIVALTYPEIQTFFDTYVTGTTPIPYNMFLAKVGVEKVEKEQSTGYFLNGRIPYIDLNPDTNQFFFREHINMNSFLESMGVQGGDVLISVNDNQYTKDNIMGLIQSARGWKIGDEVTFVIERDGKEMTLTGKAMEPKATTTSLVEMDLPETDAKVQLRKAWLKG